MDAHFITHPLENGLMADYIYGVLKWYKNLNFVGCEDYLDDESRLVLGKTAILNAF